MVTGRGITVQFTSRGRRVAPDTSYVAGQYESKAGDPRRSGRALPAFGGAPVVALEFRDFGSHIEARLGVVVVGTVTHNPNGGGYFWAVFLPGLPRVPRPALDAGKGMAAIDRKVREWCEAARLMSVRRAP